jgi:hypothetical protein
MDTSELLLTGALRSSSTFYTCGALATAVQEVSGNISAQLAAGVAVTT